MVLMNLKTRYPLTSITRPVSHDHIAGSGEQPIEVTYFF